MPDDEPVTLRLVAYFTERLQNPEQWWQVAVFAVAVGISWGVSRLTRRQLDKADGEEPRTTAAIAVALTRRIVFPVTLGLSSLVGAALMRRLALPEAMLSAAAVLALALGGIRLFAEVLKRALRPGPLLIASEHIITWFVWIVAALYLLGWTGAVGEALDAIAIPIGQTRFSLLDALRVLVTLVVFMIVAGYLGTLATRGIMASTQISIGLRVGIAKFIRLFLILIAALLALNTVGVDLAALTVFGGALGIGLGFGLQRIAANFVSGFILVGDRSIRQGDVITIGDRFGVVKDLRARYIVVQDRDGVDTLIPNENVISSEVINWSYANRAIRLKLPVQISYQDNPRKALQLLLDAAAHHPRVQKKPAPASRVMSFGDNGIDLELRFWILDPEDGVNNVRSDLYLEIWDLFEEHGVTIPFPQRDLHLKEGWPRPGPDRTAASAPE